MAEPILRQQGRPGWIGREVHVQWDELYVRILDPKNGLLLREHVRQKPGWYRIKKEHHPQKMPLQVSQLVWRAGRAGTHIGTLCNLLRCSSLPFSFPRN